MAEIKDVLKGVLTGLDLPEIDTLIEELEKDEKKVEDVDTLIKEKFIARKLAPQDTDINKHITGKVTGLFNNKFKKKFELENDEIDGKPWEEIVDHIHEKHAEEVKKLKEDAESKNDDEKVTKLTTELEEVKGKLKIKGEEIMTANKEKEELQSDFDGKVKSFKIDSLLNGAKTKLSFRDDIKDMEKEGFNAVIKNNYKFELDDDKLKIFDKEGEPVQNDKKTELVEVDELFTKLATDNGLLKMNPGGEPPKKTPTPSPEPGGGGEPEKKEHPNTTRNRERLNTAKEKLQA